MMKRFVSAALAFCLVASPIPISARQSSAVSIASLNRASVKPFQRLVITGSGFQATSAVSVVFTPKQRGVKVAVPAYAVSSTQVEVIVPPLPDPQNGGFGFGAVDVQVIQISSDTVSSSNVQAGLDVAPMTAVPGTLRKGALTRGYLRALQPLLTAARTGPRATAASSAALESLVRANTDLLAKVDRVVANNAIAASADTGDDSQFVIDAKALELADQMLLAYMEGVDTFAATRLAEVSRPQAELPLCDPDTGEINANAIICNTAQAVLSHANSWTGRLLIGAGVVVLAGALIYQTPLIALTGGIVAIGLATVVASYIVSTLVCGTAATAAGSSDDMSFSETMRDQGKKILAAAKDVGAAIPAATTAALDAFVSTANAAEIPSTGPQGGTAMTMTNRDSAGTHSVTVFRGKGDAATTERVSAPASASTRPIAEVRAPAPAASVYDGSYSGSVTWFADEGEDILSGTLGLSLSITGGRLTVTAPVGGSGSVTSVGGTGGTAAGLGFRCVFNGSINASSATGPASANGTFSCTDSEGRAWGGWTANRR